MQKGYRKPMPTIKFGSSHERRHLLEAARLLIPIDLLLSERENLNFLANKRIINNRRGDQFSIRDNSITGIIRLWKSINLRE